MRGVVIFTLTISLVGCGSLEEIKTKNRQNLNSLSVGMSKSEVHQVMGNKLIRAPVEMGAFSTFSVQQIHNPYRAEILKGKDGKLYEILFYYTDVKKQDGAITDDELTPVVLTDEKVVGWGWSFLNENVTKYQMRMQPRDPTRRMLSEREAARYLNVSIDTVRRMRYSGTLPYVPKGPTGREMFYDKRDLDLWLERRKVRELE